MRRTLSSCLGLSRGHRETVETPWMWPSKVRQGVYTGGFWLAGAGRTLRSRWMEGGVWRDLVSSLQRRGILPVPTAQGPQGIRGTEVSRVGRLQGGPSQGRCLPPAQGLSMSRTIGEVCG